MSHYFLLLKIFLTYSLLSPIANAVAVTLTKTEFHRVLSVGKAEFQTLAASEGERLEVYADYESDFDNAYSRREGTEVSLIFYGGIKSRPLMNSDVLALVFCHELGHLYGGTPYSLPELRKSIEGQADDWAIRSGCLARLLERVPAGPVVENDSREWIENFCKEDGGDFCFRTLNAIKGLTRGFSRGAGEKTPSFSSPDPRQVSETLRTHPSPQCRMDSYLAAYRGIKRPACWFFRDFQSINL